MIETRNPVILIPLLNHPDINHGLLDGFKATIEMVMDESAIFFAGADMVAPVRLSNGCAVVHYGSTKEMRGKPALTGCRDVINKLKDMGFRVITTIKTERRNVRQIAALLFDHVESKNGLEIYLAR